MSTSLLAHTPASLAAVLGAGGWPAFHARQVLASLWKRGVSDPREMTDLPRELRNWLAVHIPATTAEELERREAADGTLKLLLRWADGATTETVMIPARARSNAGGQGRARRTACLSSQVGCGVGCRFCASGTLGVLRNLSTGEILEQAWRVARLLADRGERLSHIVYMGMGEPLANYATTVESARRLTAPWGLDLAQRRVTISTVGLPKQIDRLAGEGLQCTLALSLHACDDRLRSELIPWARGIELAALLPACRRYRSLTGRTVTFEYCLLAGVNDRPQDARRLAGLARELGAHVNLLLYNPVPGLPFARPERPAALAFLAALRGAGARATLRESRGLDSDAACGQLRRRHEQAAATAPSTS